MKYSAYLYVNRGEDYDLPYRESIESVLWCDEIIVGTDPRFKDGTIKVLKDLEVKHDNVHLVVKEFDFDHPNPHGNIKQGLREQCTGDWLIELDADEYFLQPQIDNFKNLCERCSAKILLIEVPMVTFFNGNYINTDMPQFRTLASRNTSLIRHTHNEPNLYGRMGAQYITTVGLKYSANVRFDKLIIHHYGWYSLPRKWEMTHQTLHYYEGRLDGKYSGLDSYERNLDNEEVYFWDIVPILPIENYIGAIYAEMRKHKDNLNRFRGKHPSQMGEWLGRQLVVKVNSRFKQMVFNLLRTV